MEVQSTLEEEDYPILCTSVMHSDIFSNEFKSRVLMYYNCLPNKDLVVNPEDINTTNQFHITGNFKKELISQLRTLADFENLMLILDYQFPKLIVPVILYGKENIQNDSAQMTSMYLSHFLSQIVLNNTLSTSPAFKSFLQSKVAFESYKESPAGVEALFASSFFSNAMKYFFAEKQPDLPNSLQTFENEVKHILFNLNETLVSLKSIAEHSGAIISSFQALAAQSSANNSVRIEREDNTLNESIVFFDILKMRVLSVLKLYKRRKIYKELEHIKAIEKLMELEGKQLMMIVKREMKEKGVKLLSQNITGLVKKD